MDLFNEVHHFICGMSGSGKTYFALKELERTRKPVLFFNPQETETNFVKVDKSYDIAELLSALKSGEKLDYIPSRNIKYAKWEMDTIINEIFIKRPFSDQNIFYLAVDECHLVAQEGKNNTYLQMVATRGRVFGFRGVFIAQRPALVDKTLITQSGKHFIFHTEYESSYFKTKGLDTEKISALLGSTEADKYNYVIYERGQLTGAFKE